MSKQKYTLEYDMKRTPIMVLWQYIATPYGLEEWFADKVVQNGKTFTFTWNKSNSDAQQIAVRTGSFSRWRWEENDVDEKSYFEMKISVCELTDSTTLTIIDYAEEDELQGAIDLWSHQIDSLRRILGC